MVIWINGAFGAGKTQTAYELHRRIPGSFIYDPERLGYFISRNIPVSMKKDDFQDHKAWRDLNDSFIKYIENQYNGVIIIPMTIVNPEYFKEIVGELRSSGVDIRQFTLMASKQTLLKRLKSRGDGQNSWGARQIDRCLAGLSSEVFQHHIDTENMSIELVAEKIASLSNITLIPESMGTLRRKLSRVLTQIKHIRLFDWRI